MEIQTLILRGSLRSSLSSIQFQNIHSPATLPSAFSSDNASPRRIFMRTRSSTSYRTLRCRTGSCVAEDKTVSGAEQKAKIGRKKLAVFVSGGGSNFRSIHEAILNQTVHGEIVVLVTNKHDCGGAEYAQENGIPVIDFPKGIKNLEVISAEELVITLRSYGVEYILLAGFLKLIPTEMIRAYPKAILNIHPSLLPAFGGKGFYGMKVHEAVIASGARYSGPTIHYVDEHYDTGRILAQRAVPVLAKDTPKELAARVLHEEHKLYVEVVKALCEERITWREDGVPLIQSKENPDYFQ